MAGYDLSPLRIVGSTGEPWTDDAWLWQLAHICRHRAAPLNISGGTELFGAILTSTVLHRLQPGGFSAQALGVGAKVLRPDGSKADLGEVGELVVTQPPMGLTRQSGRTRRGTWKPTGPPSPASGATATGCVMMLMAHGIFWADPTTL